MLKMRIPSSVGPIKANTIRYLRLPDHCTMAEPPIQECNYKMKVVRVVYLIDRKVQS